MKNIFFLILLVAIFANGGEEQTKNELDSNKTFIQEPLVLGHSMKGWELYSWSEGAKWKFSILMGTNRGKSLNEVLASKYKVTGVDSLKNLLNQLPENEFVSWQNKVGMDVNAMISIPDATIVNEVKNYCQIRKLNLLGPFF